MTSDRTNLDVAYDGFMKAPSGRTRYRIEKALDAIHPALADLTPDDVAAIFDLFTTTFGVLVDSPLGGPKVLEARHAWEVLSRDQ